MGSSPSTVRMLIAVLAVGVASGSIAIGSAGAAFPGANGKITFTSDRDGDDAIFVMDPDGQNPTRIATAFTGRPTFSADGERIAFQNNPDGDFEIFVVDPDGQNQIPVTSNLMDDVQPTFAPDGRIAFNGDGDGDEEIFVMDADGQNQTQLTFSSMPGMDLDARPAFSPDGSRIAFTSDRHGEHEIFVMDADGQNQTRLTFNSVTDDDVAFSPDGSRLAFTSERDGNFEIYVMDANGQNQTRLTFNSTTDDEPAFSPDGQSIAFSSSEGGDDEISVIPAAGGAPVPLTVNSADDSNPEWQPLNPPLCDLSSQAKQKSAKKVTATAVCQNEDASLAVDGSLRVPKVPAAGAAAAKARTFELAPVAADLQPRQPANLELLVPKKARKKLKAAFEAGKKGKATLTATATDDLGASTGDAQQVKLKKRKK
jgi:Tol biopolymer transport system component